MIFKGNKACNMRFLPSRLFLFLIAFSAVLFFTGCPDNTEEEQRSREQRFFDLYVSSNYPDANPRPNGLYFIEHKEGFGNFPDSDDWIKLNYVTYLIPSEEIIETYMKNVAVDNNLYQEEVLYGPYKVQTGTGVEGLTEGLMMMREGGQATIFFTSDLGYGAKGHGKVQPYQSLKYEVELLEVIKDIQTYEKNRMEAYADTISGADTIHDPVTDAVMYYVIDETGEGDSIENETPVEIAYKGYLIDGRVFDESDEDAPFGFTVGGVEVIEGWNYGVPRFLKGGKGRLIIPYQLGYGEPGETNSSGLTTIPPYETLIFDIEVVDVNPPEDNGSNPQD